MFVGGMLKGYGDTEAGNALLEVEDDLTCVDDLANLVQVTKSDFSELTYDADCSASNTGPSCASLHCLALALKQSTKGMLQSAASAARAAA